MANQSTLCVGGKDSLFLFSALSMSNSVVIHSDAKSTSTLLFDLESTVITISGEYLMRDSDKSNVACHVLYNDTYAGIAVL